MNTYSKPFPTMKPTILFFLLILSLTSSSQIKQTPIVAQDILTSIKYLGNLNDAVRFTDKSGEYLVITTETGVVNVKDKTADMELKKADLYAYCYKMNDNKPTLYW
jgi:hypothetical protein